jgi:hypothetical protein
MGYIDSHSDHSLYDVFDGSLGFDGGRPEGSIDFYGFHLMPSGTGTYNVQYDGHAGRIDTVDPDDYDDILELVDDLMTHVFEAHHFDYQDDKEALVEWAGKIMTDDKERAEQNPELYIHVPRDRPSSFDE